MQGAPLVQHLRGYRRCPISSPQAEGGPANCITPQPIMGGEILRSTGSQYQPQKTPEMGVAPGTWNANVAVIGGCGRGRGWSPRCPQTQRRLHSSIRHLSSAPGTGPGISRSPQRRRRDTNYRSSGLSLPDYRRRRRGRDVWLLLAPGAEEDEGGEDTGDVAVLPGLPAARHRASVWCTGRPR